MDLTRLEVVTVTETNRALVLPIYFVADESSSMEGVVDELNSGLKELLDSMHLEGMAAAKVRLTVIGFSNDARCYLDLADIREVAKMPELTADGGTSYAAAFNALYNRLDSDVDRLKAQGFRVHRPAVFLLTDGAPTDDPDTLWRSVLAKLKDPNYPRRPNILAFGIGNVAPEIILQVASDPTCAYVSANGAAVGQAVSDFCTMLVQSIVSSAAAAASGETSLQLEAPKGFTLAMDAVG